MVWRKSGKSGIITMPWGNAIVNCEQQVIALFLVFGLFMMALGRARTKRSAYPHQNPQQHA
jgi:hypothetical protein